MAHPFRTSRNIPPTPYSRDRQAIIDPIETALKMLARLTKDPMLAMLPAEPMDPTDAKLP